MNAALIFSYALAGVLAVASIAVTVQLARGNWLFLVIGHQAESGDPDKLAKGRKTAARMAFVTGTFALLMITIILYKTGELLSYPTVLTFGLYANNVAFVLFIIALVAFYVMQRAFKDPLAKDEKLPAASRGGRATDPEREQGGKRRFFADRTVTSQQARMERRAQKARIDAFPTATLVLLICVAVGAFGTGILFSLV